MSRGNWFVSFAAAVLLLTIAVRANQQFSGLRPQASDSRPQVPGLGPQDTDYLGSASCERCHQKEYAAWKNSLHIKMTKPVAEATILGDFRDGTKFSDHDRAYSFSTKNGKPVIAISFGGKRSEEHTSELQSH